MKRFYFKKETEVGKEKPVLLIQSFKEKTELEVNGNKIEVLNVLMNIVDHVLHLPMFEDVDRLVFLTLVPKAVLSDDK